MILPVEFPVEIFEIPSAAKDAPPSAETWRSLRRLGVERISPCRDNVYLESYERLLADLGRLEPRTQTLLDQRQEVLAPGCSWERVLWRLFSAYLREIRVAPLLPGGRGFELSEGRLTVSRSGLEKRGIVDEIAGQLTAGGLCVNVLSLSKAQSAINLRAVPLQFGPRGQRALKSDLGLQQQIAHAYWQTVWAEGAARGPAGDTSPVAFLPVRRGPRSESVPVEFAPLDKNRVLVGRETVLRYRLRQLCEAGGLGFDSRLDRFEAQLGAEASVAAEKHEEALDRLNAVGFVDRWIGENEQLVGRGRRLAVSRLVPVAGCGVLSELAPAVQGSPYTSPELVTGKLLAAANSVFFLNFPEEYRHVHTAMNDLVGLLVVEGEVWQPPILRRASILFGEDGTATIALVSMADCRIDLGGSIGELDRLSINPRASSRESPALYTPIYRAHLPPDRNKTPSCEGIDLVIVDKRIVEVQANGGAEIPMSGFVLSLPGMTRERMMRHISDYGADVRIDLDLSHLGLSRIHTAMAAGPQLLRDGQPLSPNYLTTGPEEFHPLREGPGGVLESGVPPTRFPHHVHRVRAPRTALGITADGELLLVTVDGRNAEHSVGMTLLELARFLCRLGCREAVNLDGGGSTVMYLSPDRCHVPPLSEEVPAGVVSLPSDVGGKDRLIPAPCAVFDVSIKG